MTISSLKVIPVAIGTDANRNELEKITTNRKNLVTSPKDEEAKSLGRKIMSTVIKGEEILHCRHYYCAVLCLLILSI